jgi:MYXO-CTERM domain-containing protein
VAAVTFGAATTGKTFEWDTSGNPLGLSVTGENGAFTALLDGNDGTADTNPALYGPGSDVGSPGTAVPEPAAGLLGMLGLAAILRRRRAGC